MNERIEIPEGGEKALYSQRFREVAKGYKIKGWSFALLDIILTVIIIISYTNGRSSKMDLTITVAILSVLTFPFILSTFNKGSQLISDIESDRIQVVGGILTKMTEEKSRRKTVLQLFLDKTKISINKMYCENLEVNDRIRIVRGVSSKIAVSAMKDTEAS